MIHLFTINRISESYLWCVQIPIPIQIQLQLQFEIEMISCVVFRRVWVCGDENDDVECTAGTHHSLGFASDVITVNYSIYFFEFKCEYLFACLIWENTRHYIHNIHNHMHHHKNMLLNPSTCLSVRISLRTWFDTWWRPSCCWKMRSYTEESSLLIRSTENSA